MTSPRRSPMTATESAPNRRRSTDARGTVRAHAARQPRWRRHRRRRSTAFAAVGRIARAATTRWSNNGEKLEVSYHGDDRVHRRRHGRQEPVAGRLAEDQGRRLLRRRHTVEFSADARQHRAAVLGRQVRSGRSSRKGASGWRRCCRDSSGRPGSAPGARRAHHKARAPPACFAEIALIEGSWAKRVYFTELLKIAALDPRDVAAGARAGRPRNRLGLRAGVAADRPADSCWSTTPRGRRTSTPRERSIPTSRCARVFSSALKRGPVTPALLAGVLDASTAIESDFEAGVAARQVAKLQPLDATTREPFFKALDTVDSDFEHRRVLTASLSRTDVSPETLRQLRSSPPRRSIRTSKGVVAAAVREGGRRSKGRCARRSSARVETIDSAFERGRVLQAVAQARRRVRRDRSWPCSRPRSTMGSSFETVAGAARPSPRSHADAARRATPTSTPPSKLGDFEQGRVLSALVRSERRDASD